MNTACLSDRVNEAAAAWLSLIDWRNGVSKDIISDLIRDDPEFMDGVGPCECEDQEFIGGRWKYEDERGTFLFQIAVNCRGSLVYQVTRI